LAFTEPMRFVLKCHRYSRGSVYICWSIFIYE